MTTQPTTRRRVLHRVLRSQERADLRARVVAAARRCRNRAALKRALLMLRSGSK